MLALQLWRLKALCKKHELDYHLVDYSLTYAENKKYLMSLVFKEEEDVVQEGESQEEWYMKEHFLTYYVGCIQEGKTVSKEMGPAIQVGFSLKQWIASHNAQ